MGKRAINIFMPVRPSVFQYETILLPLVGILKNFDLFLIDLTRKFCNY